MKNKVTKVLVYTLLFLTFTQGQQLHANYYPHATREINAYFLGTHNLNFTLHASGYSYARSGRVTNMWTTSRASWPSRISNERTWKSATVNGEYANGAFYHELLAPFPWGDITLLSGTKTTNILF